MVSEQKKAAEKASKAPDLSHLKNLLREEFVTRTISPKNEQAVTGVLMDVLDTASAAVAKQDSATEEVARKALKNPKIVQEMRVGLGTSAAMAFSAKVKLPDETVYLAVATQGKNIDIALFDEKKKFAGQLNAILGHMDELNKLVTFGVPPTSHAVAMKNVFREDKIEKSDASSDIISNAPEKEDRFFKVKKVIE